MNRSIAAALTVVSLSACGTTVSYAPVAHSPRHLASRAPSTVEIFEGEPPTRPYVVVGTIATAPDSMYADTEMSPKLLDEMRKKAAHVGCDGLVMQGSSPAPVATFGGRAIASVSYRASCIVFSAPSDPPTASR